MSTESRLGSHDGRTHFFRKAYVVKARRGDHTVLMDFARGAYFSLDGVGTLVWECLEATTSVEAIAERVAAEYNAPHERIAQDVRGLLDQLLAARLVSAE